MSIKKKTRSHCKHQEALQCSAKTIDTPKPMYTSNSQHKALYVHLFKVPK